MADVEQRKHRRSAGSNRLYEGRRHILFYRITELYIEFRYSDMWVAIIFSSFINS